MSFKERFYDIFNLLILKIATKEITSNRKIILYAGIHPGKLFDGSKILINS